MKVPPGDGYTVSIWIKPVELGNIPIEVKAQSSQMADAVLRKILVKVMLWNVFLISLNIWLCKTIGLKSTTLTLKWHIM